MLKFLSLLLFWLCGFVAFCAEAPRLAVIITINGLQNYQIESYSKVLGKDGLKKIISSGFYTPKASCSYMPTDAVADYASIMTGSTPHYHGIVAEKFFSLLDNDIVSSIDDARYDGINTDVAVSPRLLQASTLADQIKINNAQSKVFSIALNAENAIMMAGHLADAAIWLDNESGCICTSKFYDRGLPNWAEKFNRENSIYNLTLSNWEPQFSLTRYSYAPDGNYFAEINPSFIKFKDSDSMCKRIEKLKNSPGINSLMRELAVRAIKDEQMGTDNAPDLLCVEFSLNSPYDKVLCAENEDLIIKLDEEIKSLLNVIEISVGFENCVIVLTAPHHNSVNEDLLDNDKMNNGKFNANRSMALLNGYLMAIYGQGKWVAGYYDKNINLNKSLIEDRRIRLNEIEDYAAQFIMEFSGVQAAYPAYQIQTASSMLNDTPSRLRNSHYKNRSGDVVFTLLPGWAEYDDRVDKILLPTSTQPLVPVAIWAEGMSCSDDDIMLEDICPTLCNLLKIPYTNACIGNTLLFK